MSSQVAEAVFYDGIRSTPHRAQVCGIDAEQLLIRYGDELQHERHYFYRDMHLIGALGRMHPVIEFADDARLEFQQHLPEWLNLNDKEKLHSIWKLERSPGLIFFSVLLVVALAFGAIKWGIPAASYHVAQHLPEKTLYLIGHRAEEYVMELTAESQLPSSRQQAITQQYQNLAGKDAAKLLFREGKRIGANALAVPNHTIILTDELVEMVQDDRELLGVLAHEHGHLMQRHSLQQVLSSLGFSAIVIMITGDSSDLVTTVPMSMVFASYSRHFEHEADQYALHAMHARQISPQYFADFLERLAKESEEDPEAEKSFSDFFSSHPATHERIEAVKQFEAKHQLAHP